MDVESRPAKSRTRKAISRREFARQVAMMTATAAAALGGTPVLDLQNARAAQGPTQQAKSPALSARGQAEADARFQAILASCGDRLNEVQKADLRRLSNELQDSLERLRAYSLSNGDAPATVLKPLVEREKSPAAAPAARKAKG
jgi:hypothetical protein